MQQKSDATADAYVKWWLLFADYCRGKRFDSTTRPETAAESFLTHLATSENVAANTQNVAFSAICYVFREIKRRPLVGVSALRAKRPKRVPVVHSQREIHKVLSLMKGQSLLGCELMYGSGLRIGELTQIRIKDISFDRNQIHIWEAKGSKDRLVPFSKVLHDDVRRQIESVRLLWKHDRERGLNGVSLPKAWGRKSSTSHLDFAWYYLFPSDHYSPHPVSKKMLRHHRGKDCFSKALRRAVLASGISKRMTAHSLRHAFATHSAEDGVPLHFIQSNLGHSSLETTQIYTHVAKDKATSSRSPLETMLANPDIATRAKADQTKRDEPPELKLFVG